jgi:hypothetical protein
LVTFGNIANWGAENLQVNIFNGAPHKVGAAELFRVAFNEDPTNTSENVHPQLGRQGSANAPGPGEMVRLVQILPGRCDLMIISGDPNWRPSQYPVTTHEPATCLSMLVDAAAKITDKFDVVSRLAVNGRFVKHFETLEEANAEISTVLPPAMAVPPSARDFILQQNVRNHVDGYHLNRIVKFAVEPIQVFNGPLNDATQSTLIREFWAAVVHLDFNTVIPGPIFKQTEVRTVLEAIYKSFADAQTNNLTLD